MFLLGKVLKRNLMAKIYLSESYLLGIVFLLRFTKVIGSYANKYTGNQESET